MRTLTFAVAVMTIATASRTGDYFVIRKVSERDEVRVRVEEISWPKLCRYRWSELRFPDEEDMTSLVYRKDVYAVDRECITQRALRSPYTLLLFDPRKH